MKGFSLVELSIVLVILGLLTGGILTGQSLIKAAELRSITTEYGNYQTAVNTFKQKYFALPGDMSNATSFWGKLSAYCNADAGTASTTGTCNGDGDNIVENAAAANSKSERFMFWRQLSQAGLLEGNFTGIAGSSDVSHTTIGINIPASKFPAAGWALDGSVLTGQAEVYDSVYQTYYLEFGSQQTGGNWDADQPVMSAEQAWNIDKKMDDGHPAYGKVVALFWNNLCSYALDGSHAANDYNAAYKLSDNSNRCALTFQGLY